jgi:hypothetical protein
MLSRALSLAAVTLLIHCLAVAPAWAQAQNLEAGKSPSQIFAGTCNACHKSPRGLLKTVSAGSLPGFLREHYTTSSDMASLLSSFLISNGASDTRYQAKQGGDAKPAAGAEQLDRQGRRLRPAPSQEAARPDSVEPPAQGEAGRPGRNGKRLARPGETPDVARPAADGQAPAQAVIERGPDGRKLTAKQKLSKRGRPGGEESPARDEPPKTEPLTDDKAKAETAKEDSGKPEGTKPEGTKPEGAKPEATKPAADAKSEAARIEAPKEGGGETPALRADPVPPVTPAPPAASTAVSAVAPTGTPEPAVVRPPAPSETPAAVTTSAAPPAPPVAAAGPPAPPISQ